MARRSTRKKADGTCVVGFFPGAAYLFDRLISAHTCVEATDFGSSHALDQDGTGKRPYTMVYGRCNTVSSPRVQVANRYSSAEQDVEELQVEG